MKSDHPAAPIPAPQEHGMVQTLHCGRVVLRPGPTLLPPYRATLAERIRAALVRERARQERSERVVLIEGEADERCHCWPRSHTGVTPNPTGQTGDARTIPGRDDPMSPQPTDQPDQSSITTEEANTYLRRLVYEDEPPAPRATQSDHQRDSARPPKEPKSGGSAGTEPAMPSFGDPTRRLTAEELEDLEASVIGKVGDDWRLEDV